VSLALCADVFERADGGVVVAARPTLVATRLTVGTSSCISSCGAEERKSVS